MTKTKIKIKGVAFTSYIVKDIKAARQFYEEVIGLEVENNWNDRFIEYDIQGQTLAITDYGEAEGTSGTLWLEVENLDAVYADLKSQNIPIALELTETPGCFMVIVSDPSGNSLGLHQKKAN